MVINLAAILAAEARQEEVATVTPFKAPELLKTFNRNWLDLTELLARLVLERNRAEKARERRRATLLLESVPEYLTKRKLTSNDANREAVITLDPEYDRLATVVDEIVAVIKYLEGKAKSFENSFTSVKKVLGNDRPYMGGSNPRLSGDTRQPTASEIVRSSHVPPAVVTSIQRATEDAKAKQQVSGFGKARY